MDCKSYTTEEVVAERLKLGVNPTLRQLLAFYDRFVDVTEYVEIQTVPAIRQ